MNSKYSKTFLSVVLTLTVPVGMAPLQAFAQDSSQPGQASPSATNTAPTTSEAVPQPAPFTADQLDAMVAPIALYPDALVAQILGASTFPDQVAIADYWLSQNKSLTGTALSQAVDQESWDASVKALTQFPSVLDNLAKNLAWASSLGQAFHDQQSDVMAAVQAMRAKAQAAGTLQSTPQIKVIQQTPQTIIIQPANPQVVYVPQYNPTIVYGTPYVVPLYTPPVPVVTAGISFGAGIAIGAFLGGGVAVGGGWGWGWNSWGCNWGGGWGGGGNIIFNHNTYITNNNWHGGGYYPYRPWGPGPRPYTPNGGHNGDHGLIGGNGGVQHISPNRPNGGHNGDHGLIGGNGGVDHGPNGGRNGDHGLIGGNGGVQHTPASPAHPGQPGDHGMVGGNGGVEHGDRGDSFNRGNANQGRERAANQQRSRMNGNGWASRAASNRGRASMGQRQQFHQPRMQQHAMRQPHFSSGRGCR